VWVSHIFLGSIFCLIGTLLMIKRRGKESV